jgi:hypothetical protein
MPPKFQLILLVRDEASGTHVRFDLRRADLIEAVREELLRDLPKSVAKGSWHGGGYVRLDESHARHLLSDETVVETVHPPEAPIKPPIKSGEDFDGEPEPVAG